MEAEIRKDSHRRSQVFTSLILASLLGLFGLGYCLIMHPTVWEMRVYLVYLTVIMIVSQLLTWDLIWAADSSPSSLSQRRTSHD